MIKHSYGKARRIYPLVRLLPFLGWLYSTFLLQSDLSSGRRLRRRWRAEPEAVRLIFFTQPNVYRAGSTKDLVAPGGAKCFNEPASTLRSNGANQVLGEVSIKITSLRDGCLAN